MITDRDRRYLTYIRAAIALIEGRTHTGREVFLHDVDVQEAVLWRLETLAEATGKLSPALKARHPTLRWRAVYGFRNIAATPTSTCASRKSGRSSSNTYPCSRPSSRRS